MRKAALYILSLTVLLSCQKSIIVPVAYGLIHVSLENSAEIDVVTKAGEAAVNTADFHVNVSSSKSTYSYFYRELSEDIVVPAGMYTISAENVSEEASLSQPDIWGQVRYAGSTEEKEVRADGSATEFSLTCSMVNTALSVTFDELIARNFTDYKVTAYTVESRKLVYDASNTAGETPAVGYFTPALLHYEFTGLFGEEKTPITVTGTKELLPKTKLDLDFKLSLKNGGIGLTIIVDNNYSTQSETVTIEPEN